MNEQEPKPTQMLWDVTCINHGVLETLNYADNGLLVIYDHISKHKECYGKVGVLPHIERTIYDAK
jgi:hypothetical protein